MAPINAAKLTYFNGRGRAEICRWTLAQAGVEFEDYRLKEGEWATVKPSKYYKYNLPIITLIEYFVFSGWSIVRTVVVGRC